MTAAIYTARKKLKTLLLTKELGGQMVWSSDVENYSGFSMITGAELTLKFQEHIAAIKEDLEVVQGREATAIEKNVVSFQVDTKEGQQFFAKAIIIATGKQPRHLGVPGEKEFFGKGVAVCATCDAPLYKQKDAAVVGGGNSALDAALSLSKVARRVYVITPNDSIQGDEVLKSKVEMAGNVSFKYKSKTTAIEGTKVVTGVRIQSADGKEEVIPVQGVFVEVGYVPGPELENLTAKNDHGEIKVDGNLQTNVPGLFAAGDINDAWGDQIVIAAGEGAKAALAVSDYLNKLK